MLWVIYYHYCSFQLETADNCMYSVAGWKDHTTRRVQFKSPEGGFYWHSWVEMVLLLAEVLSVVSRCGWIRAVLVAVLIGYHCCLERNREKVSLLSHGEVSHPSSVSMLLMCRWVDEPQVCPISPWWLVSRCSSWVSRGNADVDSGCLSHWQTCRSRPNPGEAVGIGVGRSGPMLHQEVEVLERKEPSCHSGIHVFGPGHPLEGHMVHNEGEPKTQEGSSAAPGLPTGWPELPSQWWHNFSRPGSASCWYNGPDAPHLPESGTGWLQLQCRRHPFAAGRGSWSSGHAGPAPRWELSSHSRRPPPLRVSQHTFSGAPSWSGLSGGWLRRRS